MSNNDDSDRSAYSRLLSPDELTDEQVGYWANLAEMDVDEYRETVLDELPLIEVGREDYEHQEEMIGDGFRVGGEAVIDPCPWCEERHTHGFDEGLERGIPRPRSPHCNIAHSDLKDNGITDDYWLVWLGQGDGEWKGDSEIAQQPSAANK